ncbi:murein L,D-transpeptidase [Breoghania sp. L-A4]|nr:murein L,D-transpeptidase [Breoghania sp. L-A4]
MVDTALHAAPDAASDASAAPQADGASSTGETIPEITGTLPAGELAVSDAAADTPAELEQPAVSAPAVQAVVEPVAPVVPQAVAAFADARGELAHITLRALPEVGKAVKAHYAEEPAFLWVSDDAPNARAKAVMAALASAGDVGLDPSDYAVALPGAVLVASANGGVDLTAAQARHKASMRFEMELSAKALTYMLDARRGRVDADRLSGYHDLPRKTVDLDAAITELAGADDVAAAMVAYNPDNAEFKAMARELARLRDAGDSTRVTIADGTLLKPGRADPELANVIAAIHLRGSHTLKQAHAATLAGYVGTDEYTPELVALVKDFQKENNLSADGVVGSNTIRALVGVSNDDKIEKLVLAMERVRWLPRQLGDRRVFINQPAFTATYLQSGRDPLTMRVVVGKKSNQTNFFYDTIETVEYNPYWGVPYSIIVNEMMPKLREDPGYLDRIGYEVTTPSGRQVSSAAVDWHSVATKQSSINVRQRPGSSNALGELKILFPNKHHIYMHDTPAKALFKRDMRAFSHGCVRLADPRGMAAAVLGKTTDYVASRIAQGRNDSDDVGGNIPVYVAYFTAWPQADGEMGYFADIYDRDAHLRRAIESTRNARGA